MNLLEGGKGVEGRVGERGWGGDGGRVGERGWEGDVRERGRVDKERGWGGEGGEGRWGRRVGRGGEGRGGEGRGGEGRGEGEGRGGEGRGRGGMTVVHILIGMFNSNPMIPQYLNDNLT